MKMLKSYIKLGGYCSLYSHLRDSLVRVNRWDPEYLPQTSKCSFRIVKLI